jgi:hypothetical protein
MEKSARVRQATNDITRSMRFARLISKATDIQAEYVKCTIIVFQGKKRLNVTFIN